MSVTNFIPELWSARLASSLDRSLTLGNLANRNWEGEIAGVGSVVHIQMPQDLVVANYPASGPITYAAPTSTQTDLVIDQKRYVAFAVEDIDEAQANVSLIDVYTNRVGVALAEDIDTYLATLYTEALPANQLTATWSAADPSNYYSTMVSLAAALDVQDVPRAGRWVVVSPLIYSLIVQSPVVVAPIPTQAQTVQGGALGMLAGFELYMSNAVVIDGVGNNVHHIIAGDAESLTVATQLQEVEALRDQDRFRDLFRGLLVYGAAVPNPARLATVAITVTA